MLRICSLIATIALVLAVAAAEARPPTGKCRSPNGDVVSINRNVVAYELGRPPTGSGAVSGRLIGCLRATGNKVALSSSTFGDFWFHRPARAVKVRGSTIGFAAVLDAGYGSSFATVITLVDMRRPDKTAGVSASGLIGSLDFELARTGRDLTARRSAAWIQCPDLDDVANADPRPNCVRAGLSVNSVFAVAAGSLKPVRVARSRRIDPLSVRVRDGRVSWLQDGERRSAAMPAA